MLWPPDWRAPIVLLVSSGTDGTRKKIRSSVHECLTSWIYRWLCLRCIREQKNLMTIVQCTVGWTGPENRHNAHSFCCRKTRSTVKHSTVETVGVGSRIWILEEETGCIPKMEIPHASRTGIPSRAVLCL